LIISRTAGPRKKRRGGGDYIYPLIVPGKDQKRRMSVAEKGGGPSIPHPRRRLKETRKEAPSYFLRVAKEVKRGQSKEKNIRGGSPTALSSTTGRKRKKRKER